MTLKKMTLPFLIKQGQTKENVHQLSFMFAVFIPTHSSILPIPCFYHGREWTVKSVVNIG